LTGRSFFLIIMGIFAKFAASLVAIPSSVIGGMTTFLFCAVAVSGIAIIVRGVPFNRRNRFILTAGFALGYGATLVPDWFSHVFTYSGDNKGLQGFLDAIELIMETGFAVAAVVCMILNLWLPEEIEDTDELAVHGEEETAAVTHSKAMDLERKESGRGADSDEIRAAESGMVPAADKPKEA
jgi:uric acid-xanthine permease